MRLLVVVVEVEDYPVLLELEHILQSQAVQDTLDVHVVLPLLRLRFEVLRFVHLEQVFDVLTQVLLVDLFVEGTVLTQDHSLCLLVQEFDLVTDSIVDALIEDPENIVLLPHVDVDVLEILFRLEQLPESQFLEFLLLHDFLQFRQQVQQFPDQEIADNV